MLREAKNPQYLCLQKRWKHSKKCSI